MKETVKFYIADDGDMSVGLMPYTYLTAEMPREIVDNLKANNSLVQFEQELFDLVNKYCEYELTSTAIWNSDDEKEAEWFVQNRIEEIK